MNEKKQSVTMKETLYIKLFIQGVLGLRRSLLTMFQGYEHTLNAVLALI